MGKLKQFLKKKEEKWDYVIRKVTYTDYELEMVFGVKNDVLMKIFKAGMEKVGKKIGRDIDGDPDRIERFEVTSDFFNLIKTYVKKPFHVTKDEVERIDGMILMEYRVDKCWFERVGVDWRINVKLVGHYLEV